MRRSRTRPVHKSVSAIEREKQIQDIELQLLLQAIFQAHGFDFREYALSSLKRRVISFMNEEKIKTFSALQHEVLHSSSFMKRLLVMLSVNVTSMFRDPEFYRSFRTQIVPFLTTYPFIRIWNAGCSTGEEIFSLAIVLREEGIYDRCRIYATDFNDQVLTKAKDGIFPLSDMKQNSKNYIESGGRTSFSDYYDVRSDLVRFDPSIIRNVVFAQHNLATDASFNEFNVIFCRNVLIYFNRDLQNRVHTMLHQSLCHFGFLCLGSRESMHFTPHENEYRQLYDQKIYQRYR
jgi:chemotaxis protein methyltransferase CheR